MITIINGDLSLYMFIWVLIIVNNYYFIINTIAMIKLKVLLFIEDQKDFKTIEEIRNITSINSIPPTGEKETAGERGFKWL